MPLCHSGSAHVDGLMEARSEKKAFTATAAKQCVMPLD
jgi:hypothetical protein